MTYKAAGVDIEKADEFVKGVRRIMGRAPSQKAFGSAFELSVSTRRPTLIASCDGVGTKLKIAQLLNSHRVVGIDLVAMNVNDIVTSGARPLFFLDYISCSKIDRQKLLEVVKGIERGCKVSGCSLIGGETAEMPGMYKGTDYDLAGFCVGVLEKRPLISGRDIKPKDVLIGLASTGLHSNGFSLVRKVLSPRQLKRHKKDIFVPTAIYVRPILKLISRLKVKGIAHITGGAFYGKLSKILPRGISFIVHKGSWPIPRVFNILTRTIEIEEKEMYRTFNMGIGMVVVVSRANASKAREVFTGEGVKSWVIGEAVKGDQKVMLV